MYLRHITQLQGFNSIQPEGVLIRHVINYVRVYNTSDV